MTASAKRRADRRRAGRCCSQVVCGCSPEPAGPSPDPRSLEAKLRSMRGQAPARARPRHR